MPPGPPKLPKIKLPSSPLDSLRSIIREGRERLEKAGSDIRSLADEIRGSFPSTISTIPPGGEKTEDPGLPSPFPEEDLSLEEENLEQDIATACVPCAIGHFAGAAKLLNEAIRFRDDGIESGQVLDDIAGAIGELNAMERVDLTPERLQRTPGWERAIADQALRESRKLRHRLEGIGSMEEIEKAAADTESYFKKLNREWYRGRFSNLGSNKAEAIAGRVG
jgi:hypothetical protein